MKKFLIVICLLFVALSVYADCSCINNLYENRETDLNITKTKKHKLFRKKDLEERQESNLQEKSPFIVFPDSTNSNKGGTNVYIWRHEP